MKKFFWLFSFLCIMTMPMVSQAQDSKPAASAVSTDDIRQLGEQVKALKSIVNEDEPKPEPKPEVKSEKTMADVSDKALDMLGGAVGTVAETLKKIGPEVWRIMIIQQYASAATMVVGPVFALIASLIAMFGLRKALAVESKSSYHDSDLDTFKRVMKFVTYIAPCVCALIVAIQLSYAAGMLINPEYYALKDLLGILTGK